MNGKHSESRWSSFTVDSSSADNIEDDCTETTDFKWNEIVLCSRLSKIATNVSQIHWGIDTHSLSFFLFSLNPKGDVVLSCLPLHYRVRVNDRVPAMAWSFLSLSFSKMFSLTSLFPGSHVRLLIHATQEKQHNKVILDSSLHKLVTWHDSLNNVPLSLNLMPDSLTVSAW